MKTVYICKCSNDNKTTKKRKGIKFLRRRNRTRDWGIAAEMEGWLPLKNIWTEGGWMEGEWLVVADKKRFMYPFIPSLLPSASHRPPRLCPLCFSPAVSTTSTMHLFCIPFFWTYEGILWLGLWVWMGVMWLCHSVLRPQIADVDNLSTYDDFVELLSYLNEPWVCWKK